MVNVVGVALNGAATVEVPACMNHNAQMRRVVDQVAAVALPVTAEPAPMPVAEPVAAGVAAPAAPVEAPTVQVSATDAAGSTEHA